ncbi:MAG: AtpZ/AtpI family protein [Pseudomonadota bacterium]
MVSKAETEKATKNDADKTDPNAITEIVNSSSSLKQLSDRLDAKRSAKAAIENSEEKRKAEGRALGQGMRLASELLAAMIVGLLLGLGIDQFTGLAPLGLLVGLFVGFAAGLRNATTALSRSQEAPESASKDNA